MTEERPRADLRLAGPAAAAWLAAVAGLHLPLVVVAAGAAVALSAAAAAAATRRPAVVAVLVCAAVSAGLASARAEVRAHGPLADLAAQRASVRVDARLVDDPRRAASSTPQRVLVVARVRVVAVEGGGRRFALRRPLLVLTSDEAWLRLLPGQRVRVEGLLRPAERGDDVAAVLSARGAVDVVGRPPWHQRAAGEARAGLRAAVAPLPDLEAGLLPGLVVGDTSRLDPQLREDFRTTGLAHLTAVSGTNVAIVVGAVLLLARVTGLRLRARAPVAALALLGFVVLARPSPSVLRAAVMGGVALLALQAGTRRSALPALSAAVLVLVLVSSDLAVDPGFALSVLATAGLLVLAPGWRDALARRLPRWLAEALVVPAAAQVACGPVVVALSSQLGLLSVPANLLAVPAVAPATVVGVLAAVLSLVWLPAAQAVAWVGYPAVAWLVLVARTGADVPGAGIGVPGGVRGGLLAAAATVAGCVLLAGRRRRAVVLAVAVGVAASAALTRGLTAPAWPPPGWVAVACDVGQGDATVLRAGPASAVVVDAGPEAPLVDRCLRRLGVRHVPLLLLTHFHADHVDGVAGVLRRGTPLVLTGPLAEPAEQARDAVDAVRRQGARVAPAPLGEVRRTGNVRWTVLGPPVTYRGTRSDPNNSSVVVRAEVGGVVLLLTGDVEPEAQEDLLESVGPAGLRADVLKVPHHGSRHQSHAFLRAVGARVATISSGAGNDYGHPAPQTIDVLRRAGAAVARTDRSGDVAVAVRDGDVVVVPSRGGGGEPDALGAPAADGSATRTPARRRTRRASASSVRTPRRRRRSRRADEERSLLACLAPLGASTRAGAVQGDGRSGRAGPPQDVESLLVAPGLRCRVADTARAPDG